MGITVTITCRHAGTIKATSDGALSVGFCFSLYLRLLPVPKNILVRPMSKRLLECAMCKVSTHQVDEVVNEEEDRTEDKLAEFAKF